ncbi:MAG: hypothetical protein Fur0032_01250 [Terrimicrobiaceae bacterium]
MADDRKTEFELAVVKPLYAQILAAALLALAVPSPVNGQLSPTEKAAIGFTELQTRLGPAMPTGESVSVTMAEAPQSGSYRVNTADAAFVGKDFVFPSGGNTTSSSHATTVGRYFFGTGSLAPEIGLATNGQSIANYEANNWIGSGYLHLGTASELPVVETRDISNHSWIGSTGNSTIDTEALRRMDFAIQRDDFVGTFGLNNGSNTAVPNLMAATYNGIVVGLSNGEHSRNGTLVDGIGRTKPDIVVPTSATSWAAPTVGSAAALLIDTARAQGMLNGERSVAVKSLLLGGASKSGPAVSFSWSNNSTNPLNSVYGAGQLNIANSYDILMAGESGASNSSDVPATAWDVGSTNSSNPQRYFFNLDAVAEFTAALTWNREVVATDTNPLPFVTSYSFTSSLANLDLRLYEASGFSTGALVAASLSTVDSVELLYQSTLAAGRYMLEVSSPTDGVTYGLSWQSIPEPAGFLLVALGWGAVMVSRRRRN